MPPIFCQNNAPSGDLIPSRASLGQKNLYIPVDLILQLTNESCFNDHGTRGGQVP